MTESTDKQALEVYRVALEKTFLDGPRVMFCDPADADKYAEEYGHCTAIPLVRLSDAQAAIAQARQDEREACAKVCDEMALHMGIRCADAIRARKD